MSIILTIYRVRKLFSTKKEPKYSSTSALSFSYTFKTTYKRNHHPTYHLLGYALDLLVTVSSTCYHASTSALSTSSSSRGLTSFCYGISLLEGGFTLRCLQRLSLPGLATLLCPWQNNRFTSGQSIPVLSY